jgi:hypothetical protein
MTYIVHKQMPVKREREGVYTDRTCSAQGEYERSMQNFYGATLREDITYDRRQGRIYREDNKIFMLQGPSLAQAPSKVLALTLAMP